MNKNMRNELKIGIVCFAIFILISQFSSAPEFVKGGLMGISLCFEFVGILPEKAYQRLKNWKKYLFKH